MKTDTAHEHWNREWAEIAADSKWLAPEPEVLAWSAGLSPGARVLDLGAGVGRHALALARPGFEVVALDAAPDGLAAIEAAAAGDGLALPAVRAGMTDLPFAAESFDHVLTRNVLYHGDETVFRGAIARIRRVLKPGGSFPGAMLSARRVKFEKDEAPGREISHNTWVFDAGGDKRHPHHFCNAADLPGLFEGFEVVRLADTEHQTPGSWHWHLVMERL